MVSTVETAVMQAQESPYCNKCDLKYDSAAESDEFDSDDCSDYSDNSEEEEKVFEVNIRLFEVISTL